MDRVGRSDPATVASRRPTSTHPALTRCTHPVRTCSTYNFKGALRAPGRCWPPPMTKRRAMVALTVERRSFRPQLAGHLGAVARRAPAAFLWPFGPRRRRRALGPRGRPHGQRAATSAVARGIASGVIPPAPDPEALQDRGQGRTCGASLAGASANPGPRVLTRIHPAPVGGMARSELGPGFVAGSCSNQPASSRPDPDVAVVKQHVTHHAGHTAWRWHARGQGFESP